MAAKRSDRQLAVAVAEKGQRFVGRPGKAERLTDGELEYLQWLRRKMRAERRSK